MYLNENMAIYMILKKMKTSGIPDIRNSFRIRKLLLAEIALSR